MKDVRKMPKYKCRKEVHALKIVEIVYDVNVAYREKRESDGSAMLISDEFAPVRVSYEFIKANDPKPGGYYVVYDGGYKSFSPAYAFESAYTKLFD